jgi:hypothetical protein
MLYVNAVVAFLQGQLGTALIYFLAIVALDVVGGILLSFKWKNFSLARLKDFVVTTVGFENTVAFIGAIGLLYLAHKPITAAAVTVLAGIYGTAVLPDLYNKLSTLFFRGKLPLSALLLPTPTTGTTALSPPASTPA